MLGSKHTGDAIRRAHGMPTRSSLGYSESTIGPTSGAQLRVDVVLDAARQLPGSLVEVRVLVEEGQGEGQGQRQGQVELIIHA